MDKNSEKVKETLVTINLDGEIDIYDITGVEDVEVYMEDVLNIDTRYCEWVTTVNEVKLTVH